MTFEHLLGVNIKNLIFPYIRCDRTVIGYMDYKDELVNELLGSGCKEKKYKTETLTFLENINTWYKTQNY